MFKCSMVLDIKLQRELNERNWLISLISLIVGSIGLGVYIVIATFYENYFLELMLWVCAFAFGYGLVFLILIKKINKKAAQRNITISLEINEDLVIENDLKEGEVISTNKVYYKDLMKVRETENYLILYVNKASAVPILKSAFTPEELSTIKLWINGAKIKKTV